MILNIAPLVDKLFFALDCSSIIIELLVFFAQGVIFLLEFHVLTTGDFRCALFLALSFEHLEALEHFLSDLLRCLHVVVKFLLVDAVLSAKKLCQPGLSLLKVNSLPFVHIADLVSHDVFLDKMSCFYLPVGFVLHVVVASDVIHLLS